MHRFFRYAFPFLFVIAFYSTGWFFCDIIIRIEGRFFYYFNLVSREDFMKVLVLDSGKGGKVVYKYLESMSPGIDLIYTSDEKNMPYGERSKGEIVKLTKDMVRPFKGEFAVLAPACNTISTALIETGNLRRNIVDIITPTVKVLRRQNLRHLGVISTSFTHNSGIYSRMLGAISLPSRNLARLVEEDDLDGVRKELEVLIPPLIKRRVTRLILGCTHYELIDYIIRDMYPHLELLYPGKYQAEAVLKRLDRLKGAGHGFKRK